MKYILPIAALLCTAFIMLFTLVFMLSGMANASGDQLRAFEIGALVLVLAWVGSIVASIVLMRKGRFGLAGLVALVPMLVMFVILAAAG